MSQKGSVMKMLIYADEPLFVTTQGAIIHMLTGVKRLAGDNTAVSGTPSLDNYITLVLHCFHSLPVILLKSQWLESQWQRDEWRRGSRPLELSPLLVWLTLSVLKCIRLLSGNHGAAWGTQVLKCTFKCRYSHQRSVHFLFCGCRMKRRTCTALEWISVFILST